MQEPSAIAVGDILLVSEGIHEYVLDASGLPLHVGRREACAVRVVRLLSRGAIEVEVLSP
jgi:hypothetical protein